MLLLQDHQDINEYKNLDRLLEVVINQIKIVCEVESLKNLLKFIQFIFVQADQVGAQNIRVKFAKKMGYHEALKQLLIGDHEFKRYIRAFFRQNLTYMLPNVDNEKDSDVDIVLQEEDMSNISQWAKFIKNGKIFKLFQQETQNFEDFLMRHESHWYNCMYSYQPDNLSEHTNQVEDSNARNELTVRDRKQSFFTYNNYENMSEFQIEQNEDLSCSNIENESIPGRVYLEFLMNQQNQQNFAQPQISKEITEMLNKLNRKSLIDTLNKALRELGFYNLYSKVIGQSTIESLAEYLSLLNVLIEQDSINLSIVNEEEIYTSILNAFKRLVKYGQYQDTDHHYVQKSFDSLMKLSIGNSFNLNNNLRIKNKQAFQCYLCCIKTLCKSKDSKGCVEAIQSLTKLIKEGNTINSVMFLKNEGFEAAKEWIESLMIENKDIFCLQTTYIQKTLELCGLVSFNLGDLDNLQFLIKLLKILNQPRDSYTDQFMQKRKMIIEFVSSSIDDRNLRLDIKRRGINFIFEDITTLAALSVKMFETHFSGPNCNLTLLKQDMLVFLKVLKYQVDHNNRQLHLSNFQSVFDPNFSVPQFVQNVLKVIQNPKRENLVEKEELDMLLLYLVSQVMIAQQFKDFAVASQIFNEVMTKIDDKFKETFACLCLSHKYNKQNAQVKQHLIQGELVKTTYNDFISNLEDSNIEKGLMNLHILILLSQGSFNVISELEQTMNFNFVISTLKNGNLQLDDELFVLRSFLELCSDPRSKHSSTQVYSDAMDCCFIYLNHGCEYPETFKSFEQLFIKVQLVNTFIEQHGDNQTLRDLRNKSKVYNRSYKYTMFSFNMNKLTSSNEINQYVLIRNCKYLDAFSVLLFSANEKVQIQMFQDLQNVLQVNYLNKEVFVCSGLQDIIIHILYSICYNYKIQTNELNKRYFEGLTNVLQKSLEFGIGTNQEKMSMLLKAYQYKQYGNKKSQGKQQTLSISHQVIKAVIETLKLNDAHYKASFDDINQLECVFSLSKQYLDIRMKLEGFQTTSSIKRFVAIKLSEKVTFCLWISQSTAPNESRLVIKSNEVVIKDFQFEKLLRDFNCNLYQFNNYQFIVHNNQLTIFINGKVLYRYQLLDEGESQVNQILNSDLQHRQNSRSVRQQTRPTSLEKNAKADFIRQNEDFIQQDTVKFVTFHKMLVDAQESYIVQKQTNFIFTSSSQDPRQLIVDQALGMSLENNHFMKGLRLLKQKPNKENDPSFIQVNLPIALNKLIRQEMIYNNSSANLNSLLDQKLKQSNQAPSLPRAQSLHTFNFNRMQLSKSRSNQVSSYAVDKIKQDQYNVIHEVLSENNIEPNMTMPESPQSPTLKLKCLPDTVHFQLQFKFEDQREKQNGQIVSLKQYLSQLDSNSNIANFGLEQIPKDQTKSFLNLIFGMLSNCKDMKIDKPQAQLGLQRQASVGTMEQPTLAQINLISNENDPGAMDNKSQIDTLMTLIEQDQKFIVILQMMTALLVQNQEILAGFSEINRFQDSISQELLSILQNKMETLSEEAQAQLFKSLFQIICDDHNAVAQITLLRLKGRQLRQANENLVGQSKNNHASVTKILNNNSHKVQLIEDNGQQYVVPTISQDKQRISFLMLALQLTNHKHTHNESINLFLENLTTLLSKSEQNLNTFRQLVGFKNGILDQLFQRLILSKPMRYISIYENSLKLLEVFIHSMRTDTKYSTCNELQSIFEFILNQNFNPYEDTDMNIKVCIDIITIISIHIIVQIEKKDQEKDTTSFLVLPGKQNFLLGKLLKLDAFNIIMSLITTNNMLLKEHSIKFLQLLIVACNEFKIKFKEQEGQKILAHLIKRNRGMSSFSLCQTVLNCILSVYDNPNDLRPIGNTIVQQVMNKSLIGKDIVSQTNLALNKPRKCILRHYEFFELFLTCVHQLDSDHIKCQIFKVLTQYLNDQQNDEKMVDSAEQNLNTIIEHHFEDILRLLFNFILDQHYSMHNLLSLLPSFSSLSSNNDEESSNSENQLEFNLSTKDDLMEINTHKNQSVEHAIDLMIKIVIHDMKLEPNHSKTFDLLKHFDINLEGEHQQASSEIHKSFFQLLVITKMLNHFQKNPKVQQEYGDGCILINLNKILCNLEQLIPFNPFIILKTIKVINQMAFKNSMEVRMQMKFHKMSELRDNFIILHLTNISELILTLIGKNQNEVEVNYHLCSCKELLKSIQDFSYDVVAAKPKFIENKGAEILVLTLLFVTKTPNLGLSDQELQKLQLDLLHIITQELFQYSEIETSLQEVFPELMKAIKDSLNQKKPDLLMLSEMKHSMQEINLEDIPDSLITQLNFYINALKEQNKEMNRIRNHVQRTHVREQNQDLANKFNKKLEDYTLNLKSFNRKVQNESFNNLDNFSVSFAASSQSPTFKHK